MWMEVVYLLQRIRFLPESMMLRVRSRIEIPWADSSDLERNLKICSDKSFKIVHTFDLSKKRYFVTVARFSCQFIKEDIEKWKNNYQSWERENRKDIYSRNIGKTRWTSFKTRMKGSCFSVQELTWIWGDSSLYCAYNIHCFLSCCPYSYLFVCDSYFWAEY